MYTTLPNKVAGEDFQVYPLPQLPDDPILSSLQSDLPQWSEKLVYIRGNISGFIGRAGSSETLHSFQNFVRAFCGLAVAHSLIRVQDVTFFGMAETKMFVFQDTLGTWAYDSTHAFDSNFSDTFRKLGLIPGRNDVPETARHYFLRKRLKSIAAGMQPQASNDRLLLAAQWFFESYYGGNQLLAFLRATVALEILLGEKALSDVIGVGELLANRCAYLIGESNSEREQLLKDFRRLYDTRSKIVHRGKNRLSHAEFTDLGTLRWICARVIQAELKLLNADAGQDA